jgi:hypothetical protein
VFTSVDLTRRRGDIERAARILADAVREQPDNPRLWLGLASLQALLDDVPGALRSARNTFALDPYSLEVFAFPGRVSYDASRSATATGTPLPARAPPPRLPGAPVSPNTTVPPPGGGTGVPPQQGSAPTAPAPASPPSGPAPGTSPP